MLGYILIIKPHHPLSMQTMTMSTIFRWKISGETDDEHLWDKGMHEYIRLLIAGILSICPTWWSWEVITMIVGLLGPTQLAVHVIFATLSDAVFVIPYGIGLAAASRIGTLIGENKQRLARRLGDAILCFTLFEGILMAMVSFAVKEYILRLFTSNQAVMDMAIKLTPFYCVLVVLFAVFGSFQGILRGINRQGQSAVAVLIGAWLVSFPLACLSK